MTLHLKIELTENYERFLRRVVESEEVWMATDEENIPVFFESYEEPGAFVTPVWSDKAYANRIKSLAKDYQIVSFPLTYFMNHSLYQFQKNTETRVLIGPNWTADMAGIEIDPILLSQVLVQEMIRQRKISLPEIKDKEEMTALVYRLSQSLAYHLIETESSLPYIEEPAKSYVATEVFKAKLVIQEIFDLDLLYPLDERPDTNDEPC